MRTNKKARVYIRNQCVHVTYNWRGTDRDILLGVGTSDALHVFDEKVAGVSCLVVLSTNSQIGYAGVDVYRKSNGERVGGKFDGNPNDPHSDVYHPKSDFFDLLPVNQARALLPYCKVYPWELGVRAGSFLELGFKPTRGKREEF